MIKLTRALSFILSFYLTGCFKSPTPEEMVRIDSLRKHYDSVRTRTETLRNTPDTLEIILRQNPVHQYFFYGPNKAFVAGETSDGQIKHLVFYGDELAGKVASSLKQGDTLGFVVSKFDIASSKYDFYNAPLNDWIKKIISLNRKPFNPNN